MFILNCQWEVIRIIIFQMLNCQKLPTTNSCMIALPAVQLSAVHPENNLGSFTMIKSRNREQDTGSIDTLRNISGVTGV